MIENLKRLREPVAWIVLAVTAASIVLAMVRFALEVATGTGVSFAAETMSLSVMNLTFVVLLVALSWVCVFVPPVVERSRLLVGWAAVLVTLGTLLTLIGAIGGVVTAGGAVSVVFEFLGGILDIVLKGVGTVILWLMYRGLRGGRISAASSSSTDVVPSGASGTTWAPGEATGAAWTSAADAAAGSPARPTMGEDAGGAWPAHPVQQPQSPNGDSSSNVTRGGTSHGFDPYRLDERE